MANKVIPDEQYTVCWYVGDIQIYHKDSKAVDAVIKEIEENFGDMGVNRGREHNVVGMDI